MTKRRIFRLLTKSGLSSRAKREIWVLPMAGETPNSSSVPSLLGMTGRWVCRQSGILLVSVLVFLILSFAHASDKPKLTLDEFFNYVEFDAVKLSPDGRSIVMVTDRADWEQSIYRTDLWLYRDDGRGGGALFQLTQSGRNSAPQWSPDGRWIAFLSERSTGSTEESTAQLYLISLAGGESFPVTESDEEVHSFSWSPDSRTLYFATRTPWTKAQNDAY